MLNLTLYVNTSDGSLVAGQTSNRPVQATTLPLYVGDTLKLKVYLLQTPEGYSAADPLTSVLETLYVTGGQLSAYLDDGKVAGTVYASTTDFVAEPNGTYFTGTLSLNTAELVTLLGTNPGADAYLVIGYTELTGKTTVLRQRVRVEAGLPSVTVEPIPGETALSVEMARGMFFPLMPADGQPLVLKTPTGKLITLTPVDRDGVPDIDIVTE